MVEKEIYVWELYDGETFWIAAYDKEDAISIYLDTFCPPNMNPDILPIPLDEVEVNPMSMEDKLTLTIEGEGKESKTAFEWALEGRGLIGGTTF